MAFDLIKYYYRETPASKWRVLATSFGSGISRGLLLTIINAAAAATATGGGVPRYYFAAFVAVLLVYVACSYYSGSRAIDVVEGLIQQLRLRICDKLLYTGLRFVESRGIGVLYSRLTQDINRLSGGAMTFLGATQAAVLLVFCLIYIGWLSPVGLVVTVLTIVIGVATYFIQDRETTRNLRLSRVKEAEFFDSINDLLHGFKEIKISRAKHTEINQDVTEISAEYRSLNVRTEIMFIRSFLTTQTFTFALIAALVFLLPILSDSDTTLIFQFLAAILFLVGPLEVVVSAIPGMSRARVALQNVRQLEQTLDETISTHENRSREVAPLHFDKVRLDAVSFRFDGAHSDDRFDLGPIDLEFERGEVLFIAGGNGSGKTTLIKLLTGLYMPVSGTIRVDGKPLSGGDYQAYREMFTTIFNDFHLFKQLYGVEAPALEKLDELLRILELDQKTHYRDDRFTTISLSTGQRKRLAYAVCYLEDRQIFVFDEFAADQDPGFRRFFYRELLPELKRQGKTVIAVTHDDSYFNASDRLVKMDYGQIVEQEGELRTA